MNKKIVLVLMISLMMIPMIGKAQGVSQLVNTGVGNVDVDKTLDEAGTQVSNFAEIVLRQVADKSTPLCALLLIYGAVLYFIMGIRNLYRKRQGMMMMWGSLTFWVIAQVAYLVFWLLGMTL